MEENAQESFDRRVMVWVEKNEALSIVLLVLLIMVLRFFLYESPGELRKTWDSYYYLTLAESLLQDFRYSLDGFTPHTKYPIGFPLIIALLTALVGSMTLASSLLLVSSSLLLFPLLYFLARPLGRKVAVVALVLLGVSHLQIVHTNLIFGELPFTVATFLCFCGLHYCSRRWYWLPVAILAGGLAGLLRVEGLLLAPLVVFFLWRQKQLSLLWHRYCLFSGVLVACVWGVWALYLFFNGNSPVSPEYIKEVRPISLLHLLEVMIAFSFQGVMLVLLSFVGIAIIVRRRLSYLYPLLVWFLLIVASRLAWWYFDVRLFLPLNPIVILFASLGLTTLANALSKQMQNVRSLPSVIVALLVGVLWWEQSQLLRPAVFDYRIYNSLYLDNYKILDETVEWITSHIESGAVILVPEQVVYGYPLPDYSVREYAQGGNLALGGDAIYLIHDNFHFQLDMERDQDMLSLNVKASVQGGLLKLQGKVIQEFQAHTHADDSRSLQVVRIESIKRVN